MFYGQHNSRLKTRKSLMTGLYALYGANVWTILKADRGKIEVCALDKRD